MCVCGNPIVSRWLYSVMLGGLEAIPRPAGMSSLFLALFVVSHDSITT